ncbi:MAG: FkbM family methyltransferase [Clostridiales bacterium]|nr:FkbM family methyltransferase [Clostridiales bacterium]
MEKNNVRGLGIVELLSEHISIWDYLAKTDRPIVLYGMGDGAIKVMNALSQYGKKPDAIFASDEFVRGHKFLSYPVLKLADIEEMYEHPIILLCFAAGYDSLINKIYDLASRHELYAPDLPVIGGGLFDYQYVLDNQNDIEEVYGLLEDELSRRVLINVLNFKISGKIDYLKDITTMRDEVFENIIVPKSCDTYIDAGAYNGDTIEEILHFTGGELGRIIAFEPDKKNFKKLQRNTQSLQFVQLHYAGVWNEDSTVNFLSKAGRHSSISGKGAPVQMRSIDKVLAGDPADIMKFDVEGAEFEALLGAQDTIAEHSPRIMLSLYHRNEDIFKLPLLLKRLNPKYRFFMRHHHYIPAWETNLYASI